MRTSCSPTATTRCLRSSPSKAWGFRCQASPRSSPRPYAGTTHRLNIAALAAAAAAAAVLGDNAGYWIGKTGGQRLAERYGHYVRLNRARLKAGRYLFARHGVTVVFFGRFVAVLRHLRRKGSGLTPGPRSVSSEWPRRAAEGSTG